MSCIVQPAFCKEQIFTSVGRNGKQARNDYNWENENSKYLQFSLELQLSFQPKKQWRSCLDCRDTSVCDRIKFKFLITVMKHLNVPIVLFIERFYSPQRSNKTSGVQRGQTTTISFCALWPCNIAQPNMLLIKSRVLWSPCGGLVGSHTRTLYAVISL